VKVVSIRFRPSLVREITFLTLAVLAVLPLWLVRHPPLQDLPQHLAAIRVLSDYGNAELGFKHWFQLSLGSTQYLSYYLAAWVLALPFGVFVANKLLLSAAIIGLPYALRALLRALDRDRDLALFAFPLTYNAHLILGFFNFIAALPLVLWGLALAVEQRVQPSRRRAIGLAVLAVVTFYTHVVPFGFLALGAALIAIGDSLKRTVLRWLLLAPSLLAAAIWTRTAPAGNAVLGALSIQAGNPGSGAQPLYWSFGDALRQIPEWLTDVLHVEHDERLLVVWGLLLLLCIGLGAGARTDDERPSVDRALRGTLIRRLACLAPLAGLAYFVSPASYDWIWPINTRFPLLALIFLLIVLPAPRGLPRFALLVGVVITSAISFTNFIRVFQRFEREEVGELDRAVNAIPKGRKVAGLIWDRGSNQVKFSPFIHAAAWYQAERGGAVMFTFADFPQSPFRFKPGDRPPRVHPRWEWEPGRVDPVNDLAWFDYVLTRGDPGSLAQRGDTFENVFRGSRWAVWKRRGR
jgi:hypothetical protein